MNKIIQAFKVKDLRKKILAVILMMVIFRFLAAIPVPGIDIEKVKEFFSENQALNFVNMLSGSAMSNFSIVMLGVGPYITASIIMQLMTMVIPQVEKWYKEEGESGRQKFNQISRLITVPIAIVQGLSMISLLKGAQVLGEIDLNTTLLILLIVTAGTIFLMWLGELISEKGIGNGVSLLIFAGIISGLPTAVAQLVSFWDETMLLTYVSVGVLSVLVIYAIVFVTEGQRNIPVNYARRVRGAKASGGNASYLPLRVNQAGVIPIIFAMSLVYAPVAIANVVATQFENVREPALAVANFFNTDLNRGILSFVLVMAFTFFYTKISFEPKNIAENLQKNGGYIPGIRPGKKTEKFLGQVSNRITLFGAMFLALIAVLPIIMQSWTGIATLSIGGTSLLIVVSVVIETIKQIEGQLIMRSYDTVSDDL